MAERKKPGLMDLIDRFGKDRIIRALRQRKFRNRKKAEERKTGQKNFGFTAGGGADMGAKKKKKKSKGPKGYVMGESYGNRAKMDYEPSERFTKGGLADYYKDIM